jgi:NAD(P)-dependent dehydrogenase (short-subunit alcohol dehydrogenase family)
MACELFRQFGLLIRRAGIRTHRRIGELRRHRRADQHSRPIQRISIWSIGVNLRGALLLSKAVLPHMLVREYGRVLHVASIAGKEGNAGMTAYSATKTGLIGHVEEPRTMSSRALPSALLPSAVIRTLWKRCHKQRSIT